jgi:hypothetical protein
MRDTPDGFADTWGEVLALKAYQSSPFEGLPKWVIATDSSSATGGFIVYDRTDMKQSTGTRIRGKLTIGGISSSTNWMRSAKSIRGQRWGRR